MKKMLELVPFYTLGQNDYGVFDDGRGTSTLPVSLIQCNQSEGNPVYNDKPDVPTIQSGLLLSVECDWSLEIGAIYYLLG